MCCTVLVVKKYSIVSRWDLVGDSSWDLGLIASAIRPTLKNGLPINAQAADAHSTVLSDRECVTMDGPTMVSVAERSDPVARRSSERSSKQQTTGAHPSKRNTRKKEEWNVPY